MCPNCTAPETWRPVPYEPFDADYEVSSRGNVRRVGLHSNPRWPVGRLLTLQTDHDGYKRVTFQSNWKDPALRKVKQATVHKMVALVFVGPQPAPKLNALHEDGNPGHNCWTNLYWDTQKRNSEDAERHGRIPKGSARYNAKLTEPDVIAIRADAERGVPIHQIAQERHVKWSTIWFVVQRRTWKHVP